MKSVNDIRQVKSINHLSVVKNIIELPIIKHKKSYAHEKRKQSSPVKI